MEAKRATEWNWPVIFLGVILSIFFAMSSTYVGLYAGMTISASIPAAVLSVIFLRRGTILEHNIVQTAASAGESLAAGILFSMPALLITGVMSSLPWYLVTSVAILGGVFGIIAMIWIRKSLIVDRDKELAYPEGRACARMLQLFMRQGASLKPLLAFMGIGAIMKALVGLFGVVRESATLVTIKGKLPNSGKETGILSVDSDISLALLAVGVIIGFNASILVLIGGVVNMLAMPAYALWSPNFSESTNLVRVARFMGIGTIVVAAFYSLITIGVELIRAERTRRRMTKGQRQHGSSVRALATNEDMKRSHQVFLAGLCMVGVFALYHYISGSFVLSLSTTIAIAVASCFFALVSSYVVGQVGSTSNPVSGMTISGLLFVCLVLLPFKDSLLANENTAKIVLLVVVGVVCSAACTAGAVSQDLKTGFLLDATPRRQQWAMIIGTIGAASILQPLLMYLHKGYGIGKGLRAPQANVFKEIVEAFLNWLSGQPLIYKEMILIGLGLGVVLSFCDWQLKKRQKAGKSNFRLYPMATAVGIYLGIGLAVPVAVGGLIALYVERKILPRNRELPEQRADRNDQSLDLTPRRVYTAEVESHFTIPAAGLIAGEAIVGILLAVLVAARMRFPLIELPDSLLTHWYSFAILMAVAIGLFCFVKTSSQRSFESARNYSKN